MTARRLVGDTGALPDRYRLVESVPSFNISCAGCGWSAAFRERDEAIEAFNTHAAQHADAKDGEE